jgi:predicted transcriptional regulator
MKQKERDRITIWIPKKAVEARLLSRLEKLAREEDRSLGQMAVRALLEFVDRAEKAKAEQR